MSKKQKNILIFVLIVFILLIGIFVIYLNKKEKISHQTTLLLQQVAPYQSTLKSHPYFDTLGLDAKPLINPQVLGCLRYHQTWALDYSLVLAEASEPSDTQYAKFVENTITEDGKKFLQDLRNQAKTQGMSIDLLKLDQQKLEQLIEGNRLLIQRYVHSIEQSHYETLTMPVSTHQPDYTLILNLHLMHVADLSLKQNKVMLHRYIMTLQKNYKNTHNLIEKMLLNLFMQHTIELLHEANQTSRQVLSIPVFTQSEFSYRKTLSSELHYSNAILMKINQQYKNSDQIDQSWMKWLPTYMQNSLFNFDYEMTINTYAEQFLFYIELSELNYIDFKHKVNQNLERKIAKHYWIKNPIGTVFAHVNHPNWHEYMVRTHLADHKIHLFNILNEQKNWSLEALNQNQQGYEYYTSKNKLCIKSPYLKQVEFNQDSCLSYQ